MNTKHEIEAIDDLLRGHGYDLRLREPEGPCPLNADWNPQWPKIAEAWKAGGMPCLLYNFRTHGSNGYTNGWGQFGTLDQALEYVPWYVPSENREWIEVPRGTK